MKLVNIYNHFRNIYLFLRDEQGNQIIKEDNSFFPYYYNPSPEGESIGYDGAPLQKVFVSSPHEIKKQCLETSYEADVKFPKRYLIDRVQTLSPTKIRWYMMDMEVLVPKGEMPSPFDTKSAPYPISCIVIYDNFTNSYYKWYLGDYKNESDLWFAFMGFLRDNPPDLLIAHNMYGFDYPYLQYRIPNFAERISPIGKSRYGRGGMDFPAGISIVDSMEWIKKFTLNKEESYALEALMEKYLGYDKGQYKNVDFSILSPEIIGRCTGDVEGMVKLEEKMGLIPHYDMIRRISLIEWEDILWNSRIIDMFLLKEAKDNNVVLPMKPKGDDVDDDFEGAFRDAFQTGAFYDVGKYDLSGAYCYAIINMCLDSVNIVSEPTEDSISIDVKDRRTQEVVESYNVRQNKDALLPKVVEKLVTEKNKLKKLMTDTNPELPEYKEIEKRYNAFKTVVLSSWGVIGNKYFRRFDRRVASMTTGIVRDLLHYTFDELEKLGYPVIYIDTDSAFNLDKGKNLEGILNKIVQEWAMDRFNKEVDIKFDYEGHFEKILILSKCRYLGYLRTPKGLKPEPKGIEMKRKDSTKFMKRFQETLIDKILDKEKQENIYGWILSQIDEIKSTPIEDVAIPCRVGKKLSEYKSTPIFIRALQETPGFNKEVGENYYYIYVKPEYYEVDKEVEKIWQVVPGKREGTTKKKILSKKKFEDLCKDLKIQLYSNPDLESQLQQANIYRETTIKKEKKARDAMAFDEDQKSHLREIDWSRMIDRNITKKLETIFNAMGWEKDMDKFRV